MPTLGFPCCAGSGEQQDLLLHFLSLHPMPSAEPVALTR